MQKAHEKKMERNYHNAWRAPLARIVGFGFEVWGLGFMVKGLKFRV